MCVCDIHLNSFNKWEEEGGRVRGMVVGWTNKMDRKGMQEKGWKLIYGLGH
jgi:hypothetical protein